VRGEGIGTAQEKHEEFPRLDIGGQPLTKRGFAVGQGHGGSERAAVLRCMKVGFDTSGKRRGRTSLWTRWEEGELTASRKKIERCGRPGALNPRFSLQGVSSVALHPHHHTRDCFCSIPKSRTRLEYSRRISRDIQRPYLPP
jgi:hypothetical protein